ncbi:hypothetical protein Tco_0995170 [Tanacetum coccineum]
MKNSIIIAYRFEITLQLCLFDGSKPKNNDEHHLKLSNFFKNFDSNSGDDLCYQGCLDQSEQDCLDRKCTGFWASAVHFWYFHYGQNSGQVSGDLYLEFISSFKLLIFALSLTNLETPLPVSPLDDDAEDARNAYFNFFNEQLEVACIMLANSNLELQKNLEIYNAYDMFEELKTMFQHQAGQELLEKVKAFHACKQKVGQSINAHVWKMKGFLDQPKRLGFPMPPVLGMNLILTSLSKDYHAFVMIYNMYSMGKTDAGLVNSQRVLQSPRQST